MPYQGNIATFPIGQSGLTGNQNLISLQPTQLVEAINVSYTDGVVEKIGGASKFNTVQIPGPAQSVLAVAYYEPTPNAPGPDQRVFAYYSRGGTANVRSATLQSPEFTLSYATGLADNVNPVFVTGGKEVLANNRKLFLFNGVDPPQVVDGGAVNLAPISTPPADWTGTNQPVFGVVHEGRMWAGGNANDPHRLYYSLNTDHEDFTGTGAGSISVYPGEGERIVGAIVFKGLLIVFKSPRGVYAIDARATDAANWTVERITGAVGASSPNAMVGIGNDDAVVWLDAVGNFRVAAGVLEFGNVSTNNLSRIHDFGWYFRTRFNLGRINRVQGIYHELKEQVHFVVSNSGDTVSNRRIIIDFNRQPPKFSVVDRDVNESIGLIRGINDDIARPIIGDDNGFVWRIDEPAYNKDGAAYDGVVEIPPSNLGFLSPEMAYRDKNGQYIEVVMDKAETAEVTYTWDYDRFRTVTVHANQRQRISGRGKWFGAEIRQSGLNQNYHPAALRLYFTLGSER